MADINNLYRTFSPKYTHYAPDGCGRDVYINDNNGGLLPNNIKVNELKKEVFQSQHFYTFRDLK